MILFCFFDTGAAFQLPSVYTQLQPRPAADYGFSGISQVLPDWIISFFAVFCPDISYPRAAGHNRPKPSARWQKNSQAALPDGTPVLVCGHYAVLPAERDELTLGAHALSLLLRSYGAGVYLCGHDHGFATAEQEGLRQITVGPPWAYPCWAGIVELDQGSFRWHTQRIYDEQSPVLLRLRDDAYSLGRRMAEGTLEPTPYSGDQDAVEWFASAYMLLADGNMTPEKSARLLADENCRKWCQVETRTVVKDWILGLLENPPEDVKHLDLPASQKHSVRTPDPF